MMISWEWNPDWGNGSRPCRFEFGGESWVFTRGGRHGHRWLPLVVLAWIALLSWVQTDPADKILAWLGGGAVLLGWTISRHFLERGWRLTQDNHLRVLTQSGATKDLGKVKTLRWLEDGDFAPFQSKSFSSMHFPMLQFEDRQGWISVLGTIPCLVSKGFQLPFSAGFFYASKTWGSFRLKTGKDRAAFIETESGSRWILFGYTRESLIQGLGLPQD